ncbi:MAG: 4-(cytidine 5'-diphospho)-2-C-methyl-D-erythritol kinase [Gammaproteobacteria bacterium]|nr:4-(cytidine 5'-diphospho)-2-C-methyl-D-erythritol kinase [Gammaproteobacteria bacterium]MCY4228493.1 4-(cytidine 5'-diphospho)-2-C-methyl-D-erythritol kinase [Gammaproteobacteria bacterium]
MNNRSNSKMPLRILSPAKINLFLRVTGKRPDGYHDLQTLFQFLQLHDIVEIELSENDVVERIDQHDFDLPEIDLTVRAARLIGQYRKPDNPPGVRITLNKTIPCGAGMGGGSSNAASVLVGLNHLWGLNLDESVLLDLGTQLGADVPIFIKGNACWAEGTGNIFSICTPPEKWHVIWIPDCVVSTRDVFEHPDLNRDNPKITYQEYQQGCCRNTLEPVVRALFKPVDHALSTLSRYGEPRLNGSGSSVFLPCDSFAEANSIRDELPMNDNIHVSCSMNTFDRFVS